MKKFIFVALIMALAATTSADDADDAGAKLHEYFAEFNAKNIATVAHEIYSTPVHIGGGSGHRIYANADAAMKSLHDLYVQIESQGWVESRIHELEVCLASDTLALVDTRYSRLDRDGKPIPPDLRTTLYVLQKLAGRWRIVAFYGHDSDKHPACN